MKAVFSEGYVTFHREESDPRFHGLRFARGEHRLMHFIAKWLNAGALMSSGSGGEGPAHDREIVPALPPMPQAAKGRAARLCLVRLLCMRGADQDWNQGRVTLILGDQINYPGRAQIDCPVRSQRGARQALLM